MRIPVALVAVLCSFLLVACAAASGEGSDVQTSDVTAKTDAAPDAAVDCVCAFHWSRGPEPIECYARGDGCAASAKCTPKLPLTEEPRCVFAE